MISLLLVVVFLSANAQKDSISVYIFLSESCPICQSETPELKSIYARYADKGVSFTGLFPNAGMSGAESIKKFAKKYSLPFDMKVDESQQLTKELAATTTPQVFVVRNSTRQILYRGKLDNRFEALGKRREVVTEHYLQNALENILNNKLPSPAETQAVGCFIIK